MTLFAWPKAAAFGRVVPKNKIYEHAGPSSALRECFVRQVEQIAWAYKLAPETVNLPATQAVTEIQVFRITLKGAELDQQVLKAIDRTIPFPLLFELIQGARIKLTAAYKKPALNQKGEAESGRWVVGNYFETDWQPEGTPRKPLPVALDMGRLYEQLLNPLVQGEIVAASEKEVGPVVRDSATAGYTASTLTGQPGGLTLEHRIALAEAIATQQKEINRIKVRLSREKQFNKRVAINAELRDAKQELERLTQQHAASPSY